MAQDHDSHEEGVSRRHALERMMWEATGVLWAVSGGVSKRVSLFGRAQAASAMAQTKPTVPVIAKDTTSFYWQTVFAGARKAGLDLGINIAELGAQSESEPGTSLTSPGMTSHDLLTLHPHVSKSFQGIELDRLRQAVYRCSMQLITSDIEASRFGRSPRHDDPTIVLLGQALQTRARIRRLANRAD
jgi:hypothetical protein